MGVPALNILLRQAVLSSTRAQGARLMMSTSKRDRTHPNSLQSCALALSEKYGLHTEAIPLFVRTLEIYVQRRSRNSPYYPEIVLAMLELARCIELASEFAAAEIIYRQALELDRLSDEYLSCERDQGEHSLALCLIRMQTPAMAQYDFAYNLSAFEDLESSSPESPISIVTLKLVAECISKSDLVTSQSIFREILDERTKVLGLEHHLTIVSMLNLARSYSDMGDIAAAEPLLQQVKKWRFETFGSEDTRNADFNLERCFRELGFASLSVSSETAEHLVSSLFPSSHLSPAIRISTTNRPEPSPLCVTSPPTHILPVS